MTDTNERAGRRSAGRRAVLAATGSLAATALSGCLGGGGGGGTPSTEGADMTGTGSGGTMATGDGEGTDSMGTATPGADSLQRHPGAADLADQPTKGPDPFEAGTAVVAFEDPSCPRCRAFERTTVPLIESRLVEPGKAAFVFRGYPVVYPWGEPATKALEATHARSADAFWALAGHYFESQSSFDSDNVLDRTRAFLADETDLDADAVVADVEGGAYDGAVDADLSAGMDADVGRTTPTVLLFRDGKYRTRASGSVSFSVVKNALGL